MSIARTLILKVSDNTWLREHGTRAPFVRRAVSRFMPGETFDDMLGGRPRAGRVRYRVGVHAPWRKRARTAPKPTPLPRIISTASSRSARSGLACEPSIKLTQLGLDIDREFAYGHALRTGARAPPTPAATSGWTWSSPPTSTSRWTSSAGCGAKSLPSASACRRTCSARSEDLADMQARGIGVRLVKGAYKEPPSVAFPLKADVDAAILRAGAADAGRRGPRAAARAPCSARTTSR